ncbi:hypothetical protein QUB76_05285, partial [Microcoleus sp. D2B6]|uniref:hypothetical protein n=1 Tax=unclassified Microcoleus TaxID=2642155 RepID=UPI002FD5D792
IATNKDFITTSLTDQPLTNNSQQSTVNSQPSTVMLFVNTNRNCYKQRFYHYIINRPTAY